MDEVTKGTWIINSHKHLLAIRSDATELAYFEATDIAGKSCSLLARLVADHSEVVPGFKVRVLANKSAIRRGELLECLRLLKMQGKIDYSDQQDGSPPDVEVYCFSARDALATASRVYDGANPTEYEEASLASLSETFVMPRLREELVDELCTEGFADSTADTVVKLQETLGLVKASSCPELSTSIYYNEHAFAGDPSRIVAAVRGLDSSEKQCVEDVLCMVDDHAGYPLDVLEARFPGKILRLMEGVGLLDGTRIESLHADAVFMTSPQLKGISIDIPVVSADVFHKAKVLLCCLRFGQLKSHYWRGKLDSYEKTLHTLNKLLRGEWVGPCTAIGQDYQLLEIDGVIETRPGATGKYGQFEMRLRQFEVGQIVKQMLTFGRVLQEDGSGEVALPDEAPVGCDIPEVRRRQILAKPTKPVQEITDKLLLSIRTGSRGMRR